MTELVGPPTGSVPRWADPEPDRAPADVPDPSHAFVATQPVDEITVDVRSAPAVSIDLPLEPDPRFAERRERVETEARVVRRGRRRLVLAWIGAVAFVALLAAGALVSPALDVDRIDVVGSKLLAPADVSARTGVHVGDPIMFTDVGSMASELRKDPQFSRVVVDRRFPSTITVRLTERRRIARLAGPTRSVIVGSDGVVIAVAKGDEFLQLIEMPTDPPARPGARLPRDVSAAVDVLGSMSFEVAVQIQKQMITEDGELVFDLGDGRTVLFGTVEDADKKLLAVKTMLGPQIDTSGLCQLDVRVPTAPTIRRKPHCDPPPPPPDPAAEAAAAAAAAAVPTTAPTTVPTTPVGPAAVTPATP